MRQILQSLKTGEIEIAVIPSPQVRAKHVLIQTRASMISAGTERMLVEFGKSNLLAKARAKPDKVRQVLEKFKTDGILPTLEAVFAKLDEPLPLGYCNVGRVLEVGAGVEGLKPGDRVVSNGPHAEIVCVPKNLCAKIPDNVTDEQATVTVLASIGLQGVRLLEPTLGERVVVVGLGLIGLLTVQLLVANGCAVLGVDLDPTRLALAERFGAVPVNVGAGGDPVGAAKAFSGGAGVDGVVITASAAGNQIIRQAAQMCRKRGRIVLVGVVGLDLDRADFYEKELSFQVSCSYGPGRYDAAYEEQGQDYPLGFVRWTEQRNFEAILSLLSSGKLDASPLVSKKFPIDEAKQAYGALTGDGGILGIVLEYQDVIPRTDTVQVRAFGGSIVKFGGASKVIGGLIGSGNFAQRTMLPALKRCPIDLKMVASRGGVSAHQAAKKFGISVIASDYKRVLEDEQVNTVFITTRHDLHARMVLEALAAGKHVMVEKPLCLTIDELRAVEAGAARHPNQLVHVGFNRRYAPHIQKAKSLLSGRTEPLTLAMTINAGVIPPSSWVHDPLMGGGRIVGEACHWIDLAAYLTGSPIRTVTARCLGEQLQGVREDKMSILLEHQDGSLSTLHYFGNGHAAHPKERIEIFGQGRVILVDNFRKLEANGWPHVGTSRLFRQDKGHQDQFRLLCERILSGGQPLQTFAELENVTLASIAAVESARSGSSISLNSFSFPSLEGPKE